jgi:hypothetical protein
MKDFSIKKLQKDLKLYTAVTCALVLFSISYIYFVSKTSDNKNIDVLLKNTKIEKIEINKMLGKTIFLRSDNILSIPNLKNEFSLNVIPVAPNQKSSLKRYELVLKSAVQKREIINGKKIYLSSNEHAFVFSEKKTSFWIVPNITDVNAAQIDVFLYIDDRRIVDGEARFALRANDNVIKDVSQIQKSKPFQKLLSCRLIGKDLLNSKSSLFRIDLQDDGLLNIQANDLLLFKDGKWQISSKKDQNLEDLSLAYVRSINDGVVEFEGWENHKKYYFAVQSDVIAPMITRKISDLLINLRLSTNNKISFYLDKKLLFLKIGDWLVRKKGKWQVIKNPDPEKFLSYNIDRDDFFILEEIFDKNKIKTISGSIYNYLRTKKLLVSVPVFFSSQNKKNNKFKKNEGNVWRQRRR